MSSSPLATKSTNTMLNTTSSPSKQQQQATAGAVDTEDKTKSMEYHRQLLAEKMASQDSDQKQYVSPSDTIMSPTTKKLSDLKAKRFGAAKPKSLFAKTMGKKLDFEKS